MLLFARRHKTLHCLPCALLTGEIDSIEWSARYHDIKNYMQDDHKENLLRLSSVDNAANTKWHVPSDIEHELYGSYMELLAPFNHNTCVLDDDLLYLW